MSSSHLYRLVKSLNQAEKRYFKLFMKRYSHNNESSIFGQLFDYLVKADDYNRNEILNQNKYIKPKQLNNIRNRLYNYILLSLRTYNSNTTNSSKFILHQTMINYEILTNKGLYLEAWKMLLKAEKIASETESYNLLKEILESKRHLANTRIKSIKIKKEIVEIQKQQNRIKKIIFYTDRFYEIHNELYEIFKQHGRVLRDTGILDSLTLELNSYQKNIEEFQQSYLASYLFYYNLTFIYQFNADWEKSEKYINIPLNKYHKFHTFKTDRFTEYRRLYITKLIILNNLRQFNEVRNLISDLKGVPELFPNNKEIDLAIFEDAFFFELESYINEFRFQKAVEIIQTNKERINLLEQDLHNVNQQSKRYRIALSYFGINEFEEALNWINKIMILDQFKYRKDILASVQLLNLLIHFELQNYTLVKNKIKTISVYLKKIGRLLFPEKLLLTTLSKIVTSKKNQQLQFTELKNQLDSHFKTNYLDSYFFCYFDLSKWLSHKISNIKSLEN